MVLDVEVQAGNRTSSQYAQPGLWAWLDQSPRERWPSLVRADIAWGTERMMLECEKRNLPYLFKIRQTTKVRSHIAQLFGRSDWTVAGQGWQAPSSELQLTGWSRPRRVVILRRRVRNALALASAEQDSTQPQLLATAELVQGGALYEYAVLATPLEDDLLAITQLYRDGAEAGNVFDAPQAFSGAGPASPRPITSAARSWPGSPR